MLNKLRNRNAKKGFTLIELMIVIAIIGILAAIAIPNFIAYRDKAFCSAIEQDASNILAALSCYFSEPTNIQCYSINSLINDSTCGFELNAKVGATLNAMLTQTGVSDGAWWKIQVTDSSTRCPRGNYYTTYMGTSLQGGWTKP